MTSARHQLSLNENFSPHLLGVRQAIIDSIESVNLTMDALAIGLSAAIAEQLDVPSGHVLAGPGSGALLQQFLNFFAGNGKEVVHAWPSFELYPRLVGNAGSTAVPVALDGFSHDLNAMAEAVTPRTGVVLVCNPNNPTGSVLGAAELTDFVNRLPPDVLVLVDEAYLDFADPATIADAVHIHRDDPRICVVRTFSKSYGLLGLRVGYLVANETVVERLMSAAPFFRVSTVAQAAALAALRATADMRRQCAEVARERDRIHRALTDLGLPVARSGGNFYWLPLGKDSSRFVEFCAAGGVAVREIAGAGVRITVGTCEANDAVIELARCFTRS